MVFFHRGENIAFFLEWCCGFGIFFWILRQTLTNYESRKWRDRYKPQANSLKVIVYGRLTVSTKSDKKKNANPHQIRINMNGSFYNGTHCAPPYHSIAYACVTALKVANWPFLKAHNMNVGQLKMLHSLCWLPYFMVRQMQCNDIWRINECISKP